MKLARLLADVELRRRSDVVMMLVRTEDAPGASVARDVLRYCSRSFAVEDLVLRPDTADMRAAWSLQGRWPWGCNLLWAGAVRHFRDHMDMLDSDDVVTLDGGDGVPVHADWIDRISRDHAKTVVAGRSVTGCVFPDSIGRWHVNGNLVLRRSLLRCRPELLELPPLDAGTESAWDCYHRRILMGECRASSVIRADWKVFGVRSHHLEEVSRSSAWWHGPKDGNLVDLARSHLAVDRPGPELVDYGPADVLAGGVGW